MPGCHGWQAQPALAIAKRTLRMRTQIRFVYLHEIILWISLTFDSNVPCTKTHIQKGAARFPTTNPKIQIERCPTESPDIICFPSYLLCPWFHPKDSLPLPLIAEHFEFSHHHHQPSFRPPRPHPKICRDPIPIGNMRGQSQHLS